MVEIERKFLVNSKLWQPKGNGVKIRQGYLSVDPQRVVRIRVAENNSYLTIKGKPVGITRTEMEYKIPDNEAEILLKMCLNVIVEKVRYTEKVGGLLWEIDVFEGKNLGLLLAEIELKEENQEFEYPEWISSEVTFDDRYQNSKLSQNPYKNWQF